MHRSRATFLVTRLSTRFKDTDMDVTVSAVGDSKGGLELSFGLGNGNLSLPWCAVCSAYCMTPKNISKVACMGMTIKFFKVVSMSVAADVATDDDSRRVFGISYLPESRAKTAM